MRKMILAVSLAYVSSSGAGQRQTLPDIGSFGEVVEAVSHATSFRMTWSNGDEAADIHVSCPDRMSQTTMNDVAMRSASIFVGKHVWESPNGTSGPWLERKDTQARKLCGKSGLVFPSELNLKSASRGKVVVNSQGTCEEWLVRMRQKNSEITYRYCIGTDKLPVSRIIDRSSFASFATFSEWNTPVDIVPPKKATPSK